MCDCSSSDNCGCQLTVPRGPRGIQGVPGPAPVITANATALSSGAAPTAVVTGTSPNLTLSLGIPAGSQGPAGVGTPGVDGIAAFASLSLGFFQPPVNSTAILTTTGTFKWAVDQEPIFIEGGGKYTVIGTPAAPWTTLVVRNDGGTGNAAPGVIVNSTGGPAQITPTGRDGTAGTNGSAGAAGTPGLAGVIEVVYSIPVSAPAANKTFVIYTDSATTPTIIRGYSWNGSVWSATVNLTPAAGTQTIFVAGDPNILLPAGPIGTIAIRTDLVSQIDYYIKSTVSTWTLQKSITIANTITQTVIAGSNLISGEVLTTDRVIGAKSRLVATPTLGNYPVDLAYEVTHIQIDKAIELDLDDTNYGGDATWVVYVENVDGSTQNITYAAGRWARDPAVTLPATLVTTATQVYVMRWNADKTRMVIENTYLITNV